MRKGLRKWRALDSEENQRQVSLAAHSPWKSLLDSHISAAPAHDRRGKVEIQHQDSHFPTALMSHSKTKKRKEKKLLHVP